MLLKEIVKARCDTSEILDVLGFSVEQLMYWIEEPLLDAIEEGKFDYLIEDEESTLGTEDY